MAFKFSRADRLLILRDSVLVVLPTLLGMAYGIASRTPVDFLTYPLVGAALLYVGLFAWMLLNLDMKPTSIRGRHIAIMGGPCISLQRLHYAQYSPWLITASG